MNDLERMKELVALLRKASRLYYQESTEMMSNYEYDALYDELTALEEKTGTVLAGSPTHQVGYEIVSSLPKKNHARPMLSLNKTKSVEELAAFIGNREGLLSWKMDGLTVVLNYENGELYEAVTRGNGEVGEIITANARTFINLPSKIPFRGHLILRGEAVISYPDFERINAAIPEGEEKYKNPRNLCAGAVRQLSSAVTAERSVRFMAFALVEKDGEAFIYRHEEMKWLAEQGFETVISRTVTGESVPDAVKLFSEEVKSYEIPSDGLVLLLDDIAYGESLGRTAKYPRNALAFKWADELETTVLINIEWSASRTGLINPVAVFEPVELEGTSVSRASVHNVSIVEELKLGYGDRITVYKANMIIPQIQDNLSRSGSIKPPAVCPVCGGSTRIKDENGVRTLYCENPECPAKQIKSFALFVSREAMNIEGLSESTLEKLIDIGAVKSFADLFRLHEHKDKIINLEGFGEKSFANLCEAAEKARTATLSSLLSGLGIANIGPATAREISGAFSEDINLIRRAAAEDFLAVEGIGQITAESLVTYFADQKNQAALDDLLSLLELKTEFTAQNEHDLSGLTFVITGSLSHFENRDVLKKLLLSRGAKVAGSVSAKTSYLINNDTTSSSSKNKAANALGIEIISEEDLIERFSLNGR